MNGLNLISYECLDAYCRIEGEALALWEIDALFTVDALWCYPPKAGA